MTDLELSEDELSYLKCFSSSTYGLNMPREISSRLSDLGLVEWMPYTAWSGTIYGLTELGRRYMDENDLWYKKGMFSE